MAKINWEMMTQFIFPEAYGIVEEVVSVQVIPRWQQSELEESLRLAGIYHIKATVKFNPKIKPDYSEGTLIEHLDLKGDKGYFEYALPLEVDLPREKVAKDCRPELLVDDISFFVYDGSSCTFKWEVKCTFDEPVVGALFQVESEEKVAERVAVLAANTGKVLERAKTDQPPSTLEHPIVNEPLQQTTIETTDYSSKMNENQQFSNSDEFTLHENPSISEEPSEEYNFVEEAKKIRKETEEVKLVNESSSKLFIDEKFKLPSDSDDFYNELSENYSVLKFRSYPSITTMK